MSDVPTLRPIAGVSAPAFGVWGADGLGLSATRHTRLKSSPSPGPQNALHYFPALTGGYLRTGWLAAWIVLARYVPFFALKRLIYHKLGMRLGPFASVGFMAMMDIFFPQDITLGDNCIVGYNTVILCHEFLRHEWRRGPVWIGHDVLIGANCTILPGVVIGDGAIVSAMSLVNRDVPPGAKVGGVPIRSLAS